MDAFTENILARARERQKIIEGYSGQEKPVLLSTPLRETNKNMTDSLTNLTDNKKTNRKEVVSDSNIGTASNLDVTPHKENLSENDIYKIVRQNSKTKVSSEIPGSPSPQLKTLNIQRENFNMEIKLTSSDNVRVEVEIEEKDDDSSDSCSQTSDSGLREDAKNRLKRLGRLYAGGEDADISSPIHRTEAKFYQIDENDNDKCKSVNNSDNKPKKGLKKLADLAQTINQWEDDVSHTTHKEESKPTTPRKAWKPPAPQPPDLLLDAKRSTPTRSHKPKAPSPPNENKCSRIKQNVTSKVDVHSDKPDNPTEGPMNPEKITKAEQDVKSTSKKVNWDKNVLDTLESQGFTRTTSNSRLVYSYNSQENQREIKTARTTQISRTLDETNVIPEEKEEDVRTADTKSPNKNVNRTGVIANKAAIFENRASPNKNSKDPALLSVSERKALFEKNKGSALVPKAAFGMSAPVKVDTIMKACESKLIGASKNNEASKNDKQEKIADRVQNFEKSIQKERHFDNIEKSLKKKNDFMPKPDNKVEKTPSKSKYPAPKPPVINEANTISTVAAVHQAGGIASKMAALLESKSTISQEQIENNIKEQRQKEMDMLLNRFHKNKEVSKETIVEVTEDSDSDNEEVNEKTAMIKDKLAKIVKNDAEPSQSGRKSAEKRKSGERIKNKSDSPKVISVLEDVKRIKVSPTKPGRLYPSLSDIEAATTETETRSPSPDNNSSFEENTYDSDDPNTSFGRDILHAVCKNQTPPKRPAYPESSPSDNSSLMEELDEILEEMDDELGSNGPTPPKHGRHNSPQSKHVAKPSNSFHYKSFSPSSKNSHFQSPAKSVASPRKSIEPLTYVIDGDSVLPLTHTVSFYRKQQNQAQTPVRQITRQQLIEEEETEKPSTENDKVIQNKIKELQEEVHKQQNIISQTSQALNLCSSTPEFFGSTEQVEAEKVLLVATHRRQAALHELQRLKVEGTMRPQGQHALNVPLEKGALTISNIVLPLKQKYVTALAAAGGKGHHVVCLIRCGEQVVCTKLVSTVASNSKNPDVDLCIPGSVTLNNIYSDFTVTFEVYCLQAQEECLPHEIKYHINNKKSGKILTTPKKSKQDSRLLRPIKESPAGPQAVRSSSFALMGYVVFSVQAVNKRVWSLNNTPSMSPLEGSVEMKISCELAVSVEHRGFLTMFEDVSGFGAWHRRWCLLKGHCLSYWKYPDDERKMAPIDTIDLKNCITKEVGLVSRDICARLHTFLVERERVAYPQDKDTLVMVCRGNKTVIRHLLSADTKEERLEWCKKFNAALTALRMWGNSQQ